MEKVASNPFIDGFIIGFADLAGSINEVVISLAKII